MTITLHKTPFPYTVIQRELPPSAVAEATALAAGTLDQYHTEAEDKEALPFARWPEDKAIPGLAAIRDWMQSPEWIGELEEAFGIDNLIWNGLGGGLHVIRPEGRLGIHVDFNRSAEGLHRRINCLYYLQGQAGVGGDLQLLKSPTAKPVKVVPLAAGTLVVFATSDSSWHGHPAPYQPDDPTNLRLSVASYYFTDAAPAGATEPHSTLFATGDDE